MERFSWRLALGLMILGVSFVSVSTAQAGTYEVKRCFPYEPLVTAPTVTKIPSGAPYGYQGGCHVAGWLTIMGMNNDFTLNQRVRARYETPFGSRFQKVSFLYGKRDRAGVAGSVTLSNGDSDLFALPGTRNNTNDYMVYEFPAGQGRTTFGSRLICTQQNCRNSDATFDLAYITMTIDDYKPPIVWGGVGTLFAGGTVSGSKNVVGVAVDGESGVKVVYALVNGYMPVAVPLTCAAPYTSFKPCPNVVDETMNVNTAAYPFVNGANQVQTCVADYTDTHVCSAATTVYVNN